MEDAAIAAKKETRMLRMVFEVDAPVGQAIGVKEALAMDLEKYGGQVRVASVEEVRPKQTSFWGKQTEI